jgi:hypothetical protein
LGKAGPLTSSYDKKNRRRPDRRRFFISEAPAYCSFPAVEEAGGWTNDFLHGDGLRCGNPVLAGAPALKDVL